jgi:hypothetical protein
VRRRRNLRAGGHARRLHPGFAASLTARFSARDPSVANAVRAAKSGHRMSAAVRRRQHPVSSPDPKWEHLPPAAEPIDHKRKQLAPLPLRAAIKSWPCSKN